MRTEEEEDERRSSVYSAQPIVICSDQPFLSISHSIHNLFMDHWRCWCLSSFFLVSIFINWMLREPRTTCVTVGKESADPCVKAFAQGGLFCVSSNTRKYDNSLPINYTHPHSPGQREAEDRKYLYQVPAWVVSCFPRVA